MAPQEPFITDPRLPIRTSAHVLSAERSASKGSSWAVHVVQKARFADLHVPDFLCARKKIGGRVTINAGSMQTTNIHPHYAPTLGSVVSYVT